MFIDGGKRVLSWSDDRSARIWLTGSSTASASMKHEPREGPYAEMDTGVRGAAASDDGELILTCGDDGTARLWHARDGSSVCPPLEHGKGESVEGGRFIEGRDRILTWTEDNARLWRTSDCSPVGGGLENVSSSKPNVADRLVLTRSHQRASLSWHMKDGSPAGDAMHHDGKVLAARASANELVAFTEKGTLDRCDLSADYDFDESALELFVEVATGTAMDDEGVVHALAPGAWEEKRKAYLRAVERRSPEPPNLHLEFSQLLSGHD
jgi:hypothetical protein